MELEGFVKVLFVFLNLFETFGNDNAGIEAACYGVDSLMMNEVQICDQMCTRLITSCTCLYYTVHSIQYTVKRRLIFLIVILLE